MTLATTAGQVLVNAGLPESLRAYNRVLDKKGIDQLLRQAAQLGPETYRDVVQHLATVGWQAAQATGASSFGPEHFRQTAIAKLTRNQLMEKIRKIRNNPEIDEDARDGQVIDLLRQASNDLTQGVLRESLADNNPLAEQVVSGARGNPTNLRSLRGMDLLYVDHKNRPIPIPILNSYSQGLTPAQYFASTFGARKGVVDTKFCLAPWTRVRLWDGGSIPLQDVCRGERLITYSFESYAFEPTTVLRIFHNGVQPCFRFFFQREDSTDQLEIAGTPQHRVLARYADQRQAKLPLGNLVSADLSLEVAIPSEELGYRLGPGWRLMHAQFLGFIPVMDLMVSGSSHLFLLENGAIVSNSVRNAGFSSKQFNQLSHRLVVSDLDDDETSSDSPRGLPVETDDPESEGALLAQAAGGYERNTTLTPRVLADLKAKGVTDILVRSPITSHHPLGGVYARDVGIREHGRLPHVGENAGLVSAQALSEPLTQMTLGSKHAGGVAAASKLGGFELLNQQVQIPSVFKGGAAHADLDGKVTGIRQAPQGGTYIEINNKEHYVGRGFRPLVKIGETVEAGDVISEGTPNPAELVRHKHIGEGQRQFINNFRRSYVESDAYGARRNIETLARGLINHVQLTQEMDSHVPGDIVPYSAIVRAYQPRDGHKTLQPSQASNLYLERPVLHYSIGTQVRPSVIKMLQKYNIPAITVHAEPPPFQPIMVRAMDNLSHDPDWMTRFLGSHVKKNFLTGVHLGHVSDEAGSSFVPALARGVDFGKHSPIVSSPLSGPTPLPPKPAASILSQMQELTNKTAGVVEELRHIFDSAEDADEFFYDDDLDDDDDWDDAGYLAYCGRHRRLPGYEDELGRDLTLLIGDDGDKFGAFRLFSADLGRVYTKPFYKLTEEQYDTMARSYGARLAEHPIICQDEQQFYRLIRSHKAG